MEPAALRSLFFACLCSLSMGATALGCSSSGAGTDGGSKGSGDDASGMPESSTADGGDGGSCLAASDSCCCEEDIVNTPTCDAHGSVSCGAGFTLHHGSECACSTPGVCCTPAADAGDGGIVCPSSPPQAGQSCASEGAKCRYPGGNGETDCGCTGGSWQCFSGCSAGITSSAVDPGLCQPQLLSESSCNPYAGVCGFTFEIPCWGDAGMPLGDLDAGVSQCTTWCKAIAPADLTSPITQCLGLDLVDGGPDGGAVLVGRCNGCGV
jgi:hypothetical protein